MRSGGRAAYLAEAAQWPRRVAFEQAHPGSGFYRVGTMTQAYVPVGGESMTVTRPTLREVLDALGKIFGG